MNSNLRGGLTLPPTVAHVGSSTPVAQQLISEANRASAPVSITGRAGLQIDSRFVWSVCPETEHLLRPPAVGQQQLQLPSPFNEHVCSAERGRRFDADGGTPGGGQVGF